jgi:predicted small metal-binding protein
MSTPNPGRGDTSGRSRASAPAASLAQLQQLNLPVERIIDQRDWNQVDQRDFEQRAIAHRYASATYTHSPSVQSQNSSAANQSQYPQVDQAKYARYGYRVPPPSLSSGSTWPKASSIHCSISEADHQHYILPDESDENERDEPEPGEHEDPLRFKRRPLGCAYSFLACSYGSEDFDEWDTHCRCHFRGYLPKSTDCPFDCDWSTTASSGEEAFDERKEHIKEVHGSSSRDLVDTSRRPSSDLIEFLWRR